MAKVGDGAVTEEPLLEKSKFQNGLNGKVRLDHRRVSVLLDRIILLLMLVNLFISLLIATYDSEPKAQLQSRQPGKSGPGNNSTMDWIGQAVAMKMRYMPDTVFYSVLLLIQCISMCIRYFDQ